MNITKLYIQLTENKIDKRYFLNQARKDPALRYIINHLMTYDETIRALKFKGLIFEIKKDEEKIQLNESFYGMGDEEDPNLEKNPEDFYSMSKNIGDEEAPTLNAEKLRKLIYYVRKRVPHLYRNFKALLTGFENSNHPEDLDKLTRFILGWCKVHGITLSPNFDIVTNPSVNEDDEYSDIEEDSGYNDQDEYTSEEKNQSSAIEKINQPEYTCYVFSVNQKKILSGYEYPNDAREHASEMVNLGPLKVYSKQFLMSKGINPEDNSSWGSESIKESKTLKDTKKDPLQCRIDKVNALELVKGIRIEYEAGAEDKDKALKMALGKLEKNPYHYTALQNGVNKIDINKKNEMVPVKKNNLVDKSNQMTKAKKKLN